MALSELRNYTETTITDPPPYLRVLQAETPEAVELLEDRNYGIIGLSDGQVEGNDRFSLPLDILRIVTFLHEQDGHLVLFDTGCFTSNESDGENTKWDIAAAQMEIRLEAVLTTLGIENVPVHRASSFVNRDPARFAHIHRRITSVVENTPRLVEKVWQIVPPSAKTKAGFDPEQPLETFNGTQLDNAKRLVRYEIDHLSLILLLQGNKFMLQTSERRSRQVIDKLRTLLPDLFTNWQGRISPVPQSYSETHIDSRSGTAYAQYGITDDDEAEEAVQKGQVPMLTHLQIIKILLRKGSSGLRKYLERNLPATFREIPDRSQLLEFIVSLNKELIWQIEKRELEILKERDPQRFESRMRSRVNAVYFDLLDLPLVDIGSFGDIGSRQQFCTELIARLERAKEIHAALGDTERLKGIDNLFDLYITILSDLEKLF